MGVCEASIFTTLATTNETPLQKKKSVKIKNKKSIPVSENKLIQHLKLDSVFDSQVVYSTFFFVHQSFLLQQTDSCY